MFKIYLSINNDSFEGKHLSASLINWEVSVDACKICINRAFAIAKQKQDFELELTWDKSNKKSI